MADPWRSQLHNIYQPHVPPRALRQASVVLGVEYPSRLVEDLGAARATASESVRQMRRASLEWNDAGGYDLIALPDGTRTRVFTKQEYRLDASGQRKLEAGAHPAGSSRGRGRGGGGSARGGRRSGGGGASAHAERSPRPSSEPRSRKDRSITEFFETSEK